MALIRPSTLLLATAMSAPALYHATVVGDLSATVAMERFLLAVVSEGKSPKVNANSGFGAHVGMRT